MIFCAIGIFIGRSQMPAACRTALGCWHLHQDNTNSYHTKKKHVIVVLLGCLSAHSV